MPRIENLIAAVFDTHVWIWSAAGDPKAEKIRDFSGTAIITAISQWEVSMLPMKGGLTLKPGGEAWLSKNLEAPVSLAPLTAESALFRFDHACLIENVLVHQRFKNDGGDCLQALTVHSTPSITIENSFFAGSAATWRVGKQRQDKQACVMEFMNVRRIERQRL